MTKRRGLYRVPTDECGFDVGSPEEHDTEGGVDTFASGDRTMRLTEMA